MTHLYATAIFGRDHEAARDAVRRFARRLLAHGDADAWHGLGTVLLVLGDRAGALTAFRNALRLDEGHVLSQLALGNLLFDSGLCEPALRCFANAAPAP